MTLKNSLTGSKGDISSMFEGQAGRGGGGGVHTHHAGSIS